MTALSELPSDMIYKILKLLTIRDAIRCGAVCKSWCVVQTRMPQLPKFPWLILSDYDHETKSTGVYSVSNKTTQRMVFPEIYGKRLVGASEGWLVALDMDRSSLSLFNPLTCTVIMLPKLPDPGDGFSLSSCVAKAILSCDPHLSAKDCVVMLISSSTQNLMFCRLGDENRKWNIPQPKALHRDVIYVKNLFYTHTCNKIHKVLDTAVSPPKFKCFSCCPPEWDKRTYLVDNMGELLLVIRFSDAFYNIVREGMRNETVLRHCTHIPNIDNVITIDPDEPNDDDDSDNYEWREFTYEFSIYRLVAKTKEWELVTSLGDKILFLGSNYSTCVSASKFPNCKPNSIYFTDDYYDKDPTYGLEDYGVFDIETEEVEPYYPTGVSFPELYPPIFFLPRVEKHP